MPGDDIQREESISLENERARDPGFRSDEGIETRQPSAPEPSQRERDQPDARQVERITDRFADKRARVIERSREMRDADRPDAALAENIAESRRDAFPQSGIDMPEMRQPTQGQDGAQPQPQPGEPARRTLKVNGKDIEITEDELIAHAQRAMASDDILNQAKRDRDLASELLRTAQSAIRPTEAHAGTPTVDEPESARAPAPSATAATKLPAEEIGKIVEQILYGNTEEASAALQAYGDQIRQSTIEAVRSELGGENLANQVRTIQNVDRRVATTRDALDRIYQANPGLQNDDVLQGAFAAATAAEMRQRILGAGMQSEQLTELISTSRLPQQEAIGMIYRRMQDEGATLPSSVDILNSAAESLVTRGMLKSAQPGREQPPQQRQQPEPGNNNRFDPRERAERKREIPTQPRRAGALPSSDPQDVSRDDRARKAIQQMRANRGRRA